MGSLAPARLGSLPAIRALATRRGRLSYMLSGHGSPAIVLFSGAGVSLQGWQPLYPAIEHLGTVFGWNRFGMQGSDAPGERQTGAGVIGALRELLAFAGVAPPYVLVAHSLGGLFANLYARLYPGDVAGVLFLESTHPEDGPLLKKHAPELVAALGKMLTLPEAFFEPNVRSELACVEETSAEIASAGPFPDVPVRVVTGGLTPRSWQVSPGVVGAKRAHQQELARLSPLGEQVIAQESGHFPQLSEPDLVLGVLRELTAVVSGAALTATLRPPGSSPAPAHPRSSPAPAACRRR